jgi:NodT family efflux transporter outer membrane factor (OMF) lipoprotein
MKSIHIFLCSSVFFSGCFSLPEKQAPLTEGALVLPEAYQTETSAELEVVDGLLELFDDPKLRTLTERALQNNPDLLATYAQLEESGFNFKKASGQQWPSLAINGSGARSDSGSDYSASNDYSLSLDAQWEVDLWGKLRNATRAASLEHSVLAATYQASQQSLAAQTMQAWFSLIAASRQLDLAQRERESFTDTYRLVERRYERGTATRTELELAHTDAANARADYQASENQRQEAARALQSLLGSYPDGQLDAANEWPKLLRTVPAGLPSDLLLTRPDILAAQQEIEAADARTKVAYADLFPSFTLTTSGGRSSEKLSDLGRSAFDVWSLAGGIAAPIFEAGQRRAEVDAAGKRAEQAYHNYRAVVINAFSEVEQALDAENYLAREETARLEAFAAAQRAVARSQRDYEAGLIELLDLLEAQRRAFTTEAQTISVRADRLSNRVSLALALGKGI